MKILIVEDEITSLKYLKMIMAKFGECVVSGDGDDAIEKFKEAHEKNERFDVILMDIMMPNLDGQLALKIIRSIEKEKEIIGTDRCKVIMTTAISEIRHVKEAFESQADGYIVKPVRREKITEEFIKLNLISA